MGGALQRRSAVQALLLKPSPVAVVVAEAGIIGTAALTLWTMGRTLLCRCGHVALWSGNVQSNENSQQLADPYSFTHMTHGVLFFWLLQWLAPRLPVPVRLLLATLIEAAWEITENT